MEKSILKRNKHLLGLFIVLMVLLMIRIFYIQIICHDDYTQKAESQYEILVEGMDTRGMILDRNYVPLIGETNQYYYFIKRDKYNYNLRKLLETIDGSEVESNSTKYYIYRTERYNEAVNSKLKEAYDAYVFQSAARYSDSQMACHLIGYLNEDEKKGVSGLEYLYQDLLEDDGGRLFIWADSAGNIITGSSPYKNKELELKSEFGSYSNESVVTTIDRRIQYVAEKSLGNCQKPGAVLVMDADKGDILAWASSPTFNPNRVEDALQSETDCLMNKVSQASYPPGSVFKIVTALAALEDGINPEESFTCTGRTEVFGIKVGCMAGPEGGHGEVNMKKAMAVSCNCYFSEIGEKIGYKKILETASKLGFGEKTMEVFPEEIKGNLPKVEETRDYDTSNISIGQGELLATPLQVCKMTAAIANGGYLVTPKIDLDDKVISQKVISDKNVDYIEKCMKEVMTSGTGKNGWEMDVYGKTGTAEAGSQGEGTNTCWFTGYCRQEDINYVITVMIENGVSATSDGLPVFKSIVDFLDNY